MWFRLVARDRWLLALLADHRVLTTDQIAAIAFTSTRRAQDRLRTLRTLGVLFAFRDSFAEGGTSPHRYALAYPGTRLIAGRRATTPPTPAAHQQQLERLAASPKLAHLLGTNQLFCDLIAHARQHWHTNPITTAVASPTTPPTSAVAELSADTAAGPDDPRPGLRVWLPEPLIAARISDHTPVRPDGYGDWRHPTGRGTRFFLEYDTGTESLTVLAGKLGHYLWPGVTLTDVHPAAQPPLHILFSVHSARRENGLRTALHTALDAALDHLARGGSYYYPHDLDALTAGLHVATAPRDHPHPHGPAGPVWAPWTPRRRDAHPQPWEPLDPPRHDLHDLP